MIVLTSESNIPVCVANECEPGKVFFGKGCFPLNSDEGCKHFKQYIGRKVLLVADPTTLKLTCADEDFKYACLNTCCMASKREYRNICRRPRNNKKKTQNLKATV